MQLPTDKNQEIKLFIAWKLITNDKSKAVKTIPTKMAELINIHCYIAGVFPAIARLFIV